MRRIRYLGRSSLEKVEAFLEQAVGAWRRDWLPPDAAVGDRLRITALNHAAAEPSSNLSWLCFTANKSRLHAGLEPAALDRIAAVALGVPTSGGGILPREVGRMALNDLARRILMQEPQADDLAEAPLEPMVPRMANVHGWLDLGVTTVLLTLDAQTVERIAPARKRAHADLRPAVECLREEPVSVSAHLDLGHISIGELLELKPGDTLVTKAALTEPLRLVVDATRNTACKGHLGNHAGRRALLALTGPIPN